MVPIQSGRTYSQGTDNEETIGHNEETSPAWERRESTEEGTWADPGRISRIFPTDETLCGDTSGKGFGN